MADQPRLTEPVVIPCILITGFETQHTASFVRIVAWVDLPTIPGEPDERRIMGRWVVPNDVAEALADDLRKGLPKRRRH